MDFALGWAHRASAVRRAHGNRFGIRAAQNRSQFRDLFIDASFPGFEAFDGRLNDFLV
jgi:hypothetical protein